MCHVCFLVETGSLIDSRRPIRAIFDDTNSCSGAIEQDCDFLQRRPLGFDEQKPDANDFNDQDDNVYEVEFPGQRRKSDRVDVLVQHAGQSSDAQAQRQAFGANAIGEDFRAVRHRQTRPRKACYAIKQEDHGEDSGAGAIIPGLRVHGGASVRSSQQKRCFDRGFLREISPSPNTESHEHAHRSNHEQCFSSPTVYQHDREDESNQPRPDLQAAVEQGLAFGVGHSHRG